jgi:acetyl-CoA C-acetyltransferase
VVAGGIESMSRVPMGSDGGAWTQDPETSLKTNFVPQGIGADLIATLDGYRREQLDAFALRSQQKAAAARRRPLPLDRAGARPERRADPRQDEFIKPNTTMEALTTCKPAFAALGPPASTAWRCASTRNCSDRAPAHGRQFLRHRRRRGAGAGRQQAAGARIGLQPRARIAAAAVTGSEPTIMLTGPAPAARKALQKAGLSVNDIDLFEVNEAFASVVLRFMRELESRRTRSTSTAAPSRWAIRSAPPAACCSAPCSTSSKRAACGAAWWPCAWAAAWASPPSSKRAEHDHHAAERRQRQRCWRRAASIR